MRTVITRELAMTGTLAKRDGDARAPTLARVLILLPPSEGKTAPRRGRAARPRARLSAPVLTATRERILDALVGLSERRTRPTCSVSAAPRPTWSPSTRACAPPRPPAPTRVYSGVLYDALGFDTLSSAAKRRATSRVAITCSVFGLVRPGDRIPAYRLSGDVSLPGLGPVAGLWRESLGEAVEDAVGTGLLVDLRSTMYAAFWRPPAEPAPRVATVRVLHEVGGTRKVVSHFNKATKGRIVRDLLEHGANPRTPQALADGARRPGLARRARRADAARHPARRGRARGLTPGQSPDSGVLTRIRWHSSHRTTSSAAAAG